MLKIIKVYIKNKKTKNFLINNLSEQKLTDTKNHRYANNLYCKSIMSIMVNGTLGKK